jgi:hypothetical protein
VSASRGDHEESGDTAFDILIDTTPIAEPGAQVKWRMEPKPDGRPERLGNRFVAWGPFRPRTMSVSRLLDIAESLADRRIALFVSHHLPRAGQPALWRQDGRS